MKILLVSMKNQKFPHRNKMISSGENVKLVISMYFLDYVTKSNSFASKIRKNCNKSYVWINIFRTSEEMCKAAASCANYEIWRYFASSRAKLDLFHSTFLHKTTISVWP